MKNSGIEWLGIIPDHWKIERLQWYLTEIKESNNPIQTDQVLSLTNKRGVIPYEEKGAQGNNAKENHADYKLAYPHTLVLNSMNVLIGSVGICDYFGCVSPVYYVFKPNSKTNLEFINYIFQTEQFQKELRRYANGIMEIRLRLSSDDILKRLVAFPSIENQSQIVAYLNKKCAQIDALILNQERQIEKLKQYKQSLITEVVTKGLDPTVPLKDSGVEWIGKIPEQWELNRIKYISEFNPPCIKKYKDEDIVSYAPMDCIKNGYMIPQEIEYSHVSSGLTYFAENDIVMAKVTPCFENGNIAIASKLTNGAAFGSSELFVFRAKNIEEKWLFYYLQSTRFVEIAKSTMTGTGGLKRVSPTFVKDHTLALPPKEKQIAAVIFLDRKCGYIESMITTKQSKIEKLNQYKKSLIYEYVTGKKEVSTYG